MTLSKIKIPSLPRYAIFNKYLKTLIIRLLLFVLSGVVSVSGTTYYSRQSGVWSSNSTWSNTSGGSIVGDGEYPVAGDVVIIEQGYTVTVDNVYACASLQIGGPGNIGTGNLTFLGSTPSLTVSGIVQLGGYGSSTRSGNITFTSGSTLTAMGIILGNTSSNPAPGVIDMTLGGTLSTGSLTVNTMTGNAWTSGNGTVILNANNNLPSSTVFSTFNNLTCNVGNTKLGKNISIIGDLKINSGATLDLLTFVANRSSSGGTLTVAGTLLLSGTSNFPSLFTTLNLNEGTVNYNNSTGSQTIYSAPTYNNLTMGNSSGKQNAGGNLLINGNLTTTLGGTLSMGSGYTLGGTLTTINNNGTIKTAVPTTTSSNPIPSGKTWGGTIEYGAISGSQTIVSAVSYNNLTLDNTSGSDQSAANLIVNGTLKTSLGGTLDLGSYCTLSGTLATIINDGTIKTSVLASTSLVPIPSGLAWGGTIEYGAIGGSQTIVSAISYNNLTLDNTSGTNLSAASLIVNGAITTASGGTLDLGSSNSLSGTFTANKNSGAINVSAPTIISSSQIPVGKTWGGSINYNSNGDQTVITGVYKNITFTGNNTKTLNGPITSSGEFIISPGTILTTFDNDITFIGNFTNNGIFNAGNSNIIISGGQTQLIYGFTTAGNVSMTKSALNATFNGNVNGNGLIINGNGGRLNLGNHLTHTFTGTFTNMAGTLNCGSCLLRIGGSVSGTTGSFLSGTGNVEWNAWGDQTLAAVTYNLLTLSGSGIKTFTNNTTIDTLSIKSSVVANLGTGLTHSSNTLSLGDFGQPAGSWGGIDSPATLKNSTYFAPVATGIINVKYKSCTPGFWIGNTNTDWNTTSNWCDGIKPTITTNVTIFPCANQPIISNAGATCKDITIYSGASLSIMNTYTLTINGNALNNGNFTAQGTSSLNYNSTTGGQTIMGGTYGNLTILNTNGTQSANSNLTVNGTLSTTSGGTLDMHSFQLSGSPVAINNHGTIATQNTSTTPIPSGKTWTGEIVYNSTSQQTVASGTYTDLTIDNAPGVYLNDTTTTTATGKLWIKSGARIEIGTNTELKADSIRNDAGTSGILVKAGSNVANGTLIFTGTAPLGTVEMYSKASWDLTDTIVNNRYKWQFFGIPVQQVTANPTFNGSYVRQWMEAGTSSSNHWLQLGNNSVLNSFLGYELCQGSPKTLVFKGQLENRDFTTQLSFTNSATYAGQHIFANPYTAAIDIGQLDFGDHTEHTVYLYNTGSYYQWSTNNGDSIRGASPGQYLAIPQTPAGNSGLPREVPSMQAMLVKALDNSDKATFGIRYQAVITKNTEKQRVKALNQPKSTDKVCTVIDVRGTHYSDRMWIFTDPTCNHQFNNGWDGSKLLGSALSPQLYAIESDGNYQVDAVDDMNNTSLGFHAGTDVDYTFTFTQSNIKSKYAGVYLRDNVENKTVDITESGSTYSFQTGSTFRTVNRFSIITRPFEQDSPDNNSELKMFSSKSTILVQNLSSLNGDLVIYDIAGHYLKNLSFTRGGIIAVTGIIPGAYIAKAWTSQGGVTKRLIVQ